MIKSPQYYFDRACNLAFEDLKNNTNVNEKKINALIEFGEKLEHYPELQNN